jgi:hypothetical protein
MYCLDFPMGLVPWVFGKRNWFPSALIRNGWNIVVVAAGQNGRHQAWTAKRGPTATRQHIPAQQGGEVAVGSPRVHAEPPSLHAHGAGVLLVRDADSGRRVAYRVIVLSRDGTKVLLVPNGERQMLPSVEIPR